MNSSKSNFNFPVPLVLFFALLLFCDLSCKEKLEEKLPAQVDFNYHIKPILVQKCYLCHGPDPSSREADLRLDTKEGATKILENGFPAIHPGNLSKSAMVNRITQNDPELKMPPPSSNLELSDQEIGLIKKWIKQGAVFQPHWAFLSPQTPESVTELSIREGVDQLIHEKLNQNELEPSVQADRYSLIRRLSYVLTGLPPSPEKIKEFVADPNPEAYNDLVDHYLSLPAFGEKWARHWMDVARYAETKGHEFDYVIQGAWHYRDYLIRAFNEDVPYDQLVKEQLMGDLLASPRYHPETGQNESVLGTMFLTMTEGTHSPVDIRKDETDRIDNMIDVTGKGFQALTVSCSKCHDHKFDPIPTKDYYAAYGILESTRFSPLPLGDEKMKNLNIKEADQLKRDIREKFAKEWNRGQSAAVPVKLAKLDSSDAEIERPFRVLGDFRSQHFAGWRPDGLAFGDQTTLGAPIFDKHHALLKLSSGMASSRIYGTGIFGALRSPDFIIDRDHIGVKARGKGGSIRIIIDNFQLISYPIYGGMDQKVKNEEWQDFVFNVADWKGRKAYIEFLPGSYIRHAYQQNSEDYIEILFAAAYNEETDFKLPPAPHSTTSGNVNRALENWSIQNNTVQEIALLNGMIQEGKLVNKFPSLEKEIFQINLLLAGVGDSLFFNGVTEGFAKESPVFIRGNHMETGESTVPRVFLSEIFSDQEPIRSNGSGRKEMAAVILSPENPLTSRVMVNRIWHHLFGTGLVETVDNFGLQGDLPAHPELLDFISIRFREEGWSIKKLIGALVKTAAFQRATPEGTENQLDQKIRYLAHYPVRRLEAEAIRDGILAVSGTLNPTLFGPSVPVHLTDFMQGRGRPSESGPLDGNGRRSIYLEVRRNFLDRMMVSFDRPTPFTTFGKRDVTNVPAQSLFLMNDPFMWEQSRKMARAVLEIPASKIENRLQYIYLLAFSRPPTDKELEMAKEFITDLGNEKNVNGEELLNSEEIWKEYCHSVFNMKSFIYLM
ncbi:MAG: PSD1 and planctomycete cytochrome C domain-containing protein [Cyclobacteriaceae bacterium]